MVVVDANLGLPALDDKRCGVTEDACGYRYVHGIYLTLEQIRRQPAALLAWNHDLTPLTFATRRRGRFYEPHDPECTLVADGSDGAEAGWTVRDGGPSAGTAVRTTFASCNGHSPGAEGVYECVLDSSACGDGEKFDYASEFPTSII